jgi:membrane protein implicated in regulation of membrane protease activity
LLRVKHQGLTLVSAIDPYARLPKEVEMFNLFQAQTLAHNTSNSQQVRQDRRQFAGEAVVDEEIQPNQRGMVYFRASWWFAQCEQAIALVPGQRVQVLGIRGTTLIVQPLTYW